MKLIYLFTILIASSNILFAATDSQPADPESLVANAEKAWQDWQIARKNIELKAISQPWETDLEFAMRKESESWLATSAEMAAWDKSILALRAATYYEGPANIKLSITPYNKKTNSFVFSITGDHSLPFEGIIEYTTKNTADFNKINPPIKSGSIMARIAFKLFPLGDFGGRYREVARSVEFGVVDAKGNFTVVASKPVLQIKDFAPGKRDKAEKAKLFDQIFVEGGGKVLSTLGSGSLAINDKVSIGPSDFTMATTLVSQDLYLQVTGLSPSKYQASRDAPWLPVENISWLEAGKFCNLISKIDDLSPVFFTKKDEEEFDIQANGWRMPTEKEIRYAFNGGKLARLGQFPGGDKIELFGPAFGVYQSEIDHIPVEKEPANDLGIRGLLANVGYWGLEGAPSTRIFFPKSDSVSIDVSLPSYKRETIGFRIVRNGGKK